MKKFFILTTIVFISISLSACNNQKTIKIGFVANLTENPSEHGIDARNGVELLVEDINNNGGLNGKKIELIVKDDTNKIEKAKQVDDEFEKEKVKFVIGHVFSSMYPAVEYVMEKDKILMISPSMSTSILEGKDDKFIRIAQTNAGQGRKVAEIVNKDKIKNIIVFYDGKNIAYTKEVVDAFKEKIMEYKINLLDVIEVKEINDNIYASVKEADGVFLLTNSRDSAIMLQDIAKINPKIKKYSTSWAVTEELIKNTGKTSENLLFVGVFQDYEEREIYIKFEKSFQNKYGYKPSGMAIRAYDAAKVLFYGIENAKNEDIKEVKNKIIENDKFEGVESSFKIDKNGDVERNYRVHIIKDGKIKDYNQD